jgi:uncharacterized ferredoxin-like protein
MNPETGIRTTEDLHRAAIEQALPIISASAVTAPKSGGQLFLRGSKPFLETVAVADKAVQSQLADWLRRRGRERREPIWFRDAMAAEAMDAILFIGLKDWYPPVYDCGACGYATCAEFLNATQPLRAGSHDLEFEGPQCNLRDIDLGIAVGSAAKTAAMLGIDARCQTRVAVAARKLGIIGADIAVALSLSVTHKNLGFDRAMPAIDFDDPGLATFGPTGTRPDASARSEP